MVSKRLVFGLVIISFIGFWDAFYLTVLHYRGEPPVCSILEGCQKVTASRYAAIGPVPVALLGVLYYLAVFLLTLGHLLASETSSTKFWVSWFRSRNLTTLAAWLTVFGFLASLWFVYLQLFVLKALCLYCMISAASSAALFVLGLLISRR